MPCISAYLLASEADAEARSRKLKPKPKPQAQGSSRRSRSADLRVSSTPFRAAAVASGGAASAYDSQALAAEVQAAPLRLWFASWHCVSSAPEIQSSCTTCTSGESTRLAGETSPRVAERPLSTA